MNHVMLDLETMGTEPGCAIVSIGAVEFDLKSGKIGEKFYCTIDLQSCVDAGLKINPSTLIWWMAQSEQAREKICSDSILLSDALDAFSLWFLRIGGVNIWGNSASFDCGILTACYKALKMPTPWAFYNEKCYRTVVNLFPSNKLKKDASKSHDPIYDCEYQIGVLCATMKNLTGKISV